MTRTFKRGDKVVWSSHGSDDTPGVVVRRITRDTELAGRTVRASEDDPQYLVAARKAAAKRSTSRPRSAAAESGRAFALPARAR